MYNIYIWTLMFTWYTQSKWFTGIATTIDGCIASDGTSITCKQITAGNTLCHLTMWEAQWNTTSKLYISITSCSVPLVGGHSEWWAIIWSYIACQSDTTPYGIVKCISRSTDWCTSWTTDNSNCKLTVNTWRMSLLI